jgi:hypothetical protein
MDDVIREAELDDLKEKIDGDGLNIAKHIQDAADLDMDDMDLDSDLRSEMIAAEEDFKSITSPGKKAPKKAKTKPKAKTKKAPAKKEKSNPKKTEKAKSTAKSSAKAPAGAAKAKG